jgi:hypothetical protein
LAPRRSGRPAAEHDQDVTEMNEVRRCASGQVQRAAASFIRMIGEPGHIDRPPRDPLEGGHTMLKTISAALLAASVLAAPALAATGKTAQAPVIKAEQVKQTKQTVQTKQTKPSVLNANARMGRHHARHASHHRHHKHYGALKTHKYSKVSTKHVPSAPRRG